MVFVLLDAWYFLWLKEEVVGEHFVDSASEREDICIYVILVSE